MIYAYHCQSVPNVNIINWALLNVSMGISDGWLVGWGVNKAPENKIQIWQRRWCVRSISYPCMGRTGLLTREKAQPPNVANSTSNVKTGYYMPPINQSTQLEYKDRCTSRFVYCPPKNKDTINWNLCTDFF